MKTFEITFRHIDGTTRNIIIEAFNEERAELRFSVNWSNDMKLLNIRKIK